VSLLSRTGIGWLVIIAGWGVFVPALILGMEWKRLVRVPLALVIVAGRVTLIVSQA
jgi:hypothetical protein